MGKIVWVASYPKSGNTWTRAFLLYLFMNPRERLPLDELNKMTTLDSSRHWFNKASGREQASYGSEEVARLRAGAQRKLAAYFNPTGFVKTHCALMPWHGHPMFDMAVTAGAIYLVRNPLDVVASYASHSGKSLNGIIDVMNEADYVTPGANEQVPQLLGSWSQNVKSWTAHPNPALHVMRYEDMVADPTAAFGGLARFLGLNPPPERLNRALEFSSFESMKQAESETGFKEKSEFQASFFRSGRKGGWRDELTPAQARRIVDAHREQMQRFGYVPEDL